MGRGLWLALAVAAGVPVTASAQVVGPVEQVVRVRFEPQSDSLIAQLEVPATGLAGEDLELVARSLGYDLDVWQGGEPLPVASALGRMEGARFYARLVYALRPGERDISARLNGSVAQAPGPVATYATYVLPAGGEQILTVRGPAARVRFDPGPFDAVRDFLVRALDAFLLGGGHLLFLACLLLPALGAREAASLFAAVAAGQGATMTASVLFPLPETAVVSLGMIGMSAVVIAGIQAIVGARFFLVLPVAILFGLANGFVFGAEINAAEPFAGSQHSIAAATYIVTVLAGTLWLGAVGWLARDWLEKAGYFPRLVMLFLSVVLIHSALHRMIEAERQLAGAPGDISSVALWLTLGWVGACLLAGLAGGSLVGAQEAKS